MATLQDYDVIIVGAGISGINSAYRLQEGLPHYTYTVLETRGEIGGTWSLFKYPGIRSDSDLFTFGFSWDPWEKSNPIADAPSILEYMNRVSKKHGIYDHIQFHNAVQKLEWKSDQQRWFVTSLVNAEKEKTISARHILMGTGYYDHKHPLAAQIPGLESFKGQIIHPQFWPEDYDYTDKTAVIIGSGATAVSILPVMAQKAKHVTQLQRSPGYFLPIPVAGQPVDNFMRRWLPTTWAHYFIRMKFMLMGWLFIRWCRRSPVKAKEFLRNITEKELPKDIPYDPNFKPRYDPWQQRMCIVPGGDFFAALRSGKASVVTDTIQTVTATGITLSSGQHLDTDIIVTATGLKLQILAGIPITIDNVPYHPNTHYAWNGSMLSGAPNLTFVFGYATASWTLGADNTATLWVRTLKAMEKEKYTSVVPEVGEDEEEKLKGKELPFLDLNSTYVTTGMQKSLMPKVTSVGPWKPRTNVILDRVHANLGDIRTGLVFRRVAVD